MPEKDQQTVVCSVNLLYGAATFCNGFSDVLLWNFTREHCHQHFHDLLFVVSMVEQNQNLARKEKEAADLRVSIMISQITPHFIYNTLTSIQQMCESDPGQAEETVEEFAEYLRGNLDSLSIKGPVPFERELNHVKCYLAIEKNVLARVSTWFMILKRKSS